MRATEIIRGVLDLIDQIDCEKEQPQVQGEVEIVASTSGEDPVQTGVDTNRFKQILDFLSADKPQVYDNSPTETVASIDAVTTNAGGGVNGPKNPADIKSNSISMYPDWQARNKE